MTNKEAKKAGFRTASGALYVYWCIKNGHIYVRSCDACALTWNDFPTRAKAREALRKRKENEEVNRKSRFIDNFVQPMQEHLSSKSKADAEHAKWLTDMQSQTTPITPEQAKKLRVGDRVWGIMFREADVTQPEYIHMQVLEDIHQVERATSFDHLYFTYAAAQAALDKAKPCDMSDDMFLNGMKCRRLPDNEPHAAGDIPVDGSQTKRFGSVWYRPIKSHETLLGETQAKEVVTDETQDKEPVKWTTYDESDTLDCNLITPEWRAWKARQDTSTNSKPTDKLETTKSFNDFSINKEAPTYSTERHGNTEDLTLQTSIVLNHERGKSPSKFISFSNYKGVIPSRFTLDMKNFDLPALQELINTNFVLMFRGQPKNKQEVAGSMQEEIYKAAIKQFVGNKYHRTIYGVTEGSLVVDVYNVLDAFGVTCPACQHAIKKLLCAGLRNKGSRLQDLTESKRSVERAVELEQQRNEGIK